MQMEGDDDAPRVIVRNDPASKGRPRWLKALIAASTVVLVPALALFSLETAKSFQNLQLFFNSWAKCMTTGQQALDEGHYDQAESMLMRALKAAEAEQGPSRATRVQIAVRALHDLYTIRGDRKSANEMLDRIKSWQSEQIVKLKEDGDALSKSLSECTASGASGDAAARQARIISTVKAISEVADRYIHLDKLNEAEELLQSTLEKLDDSANPYDESLGINFLALARLYSAENDESRAQPFYQQAADIFGRAKMPPEDSGKFAYEFALWHFSRTSQSDLAEARKYADQALYFRRGPDQSKDLADTYLLRAKIEAHLDQHNPLLVDQFLESAMQSYQRIGNTEGKAACCLFESYWRLANKQQKQGDRLLKEGLALAEAIEIVDNPQLVPGLRDAGERYVGLKDYRTAEPYLLRAKARLELQPDKESRTMVYILTSLAQIYTVTQRPELSQAVRYDIQTLETKLPQD